MMRISIAVVAVTVLLAPCLHAQDTTVYEPGNGVSLPQVVKQVKAEYTSEAMRQMIEGTVGLDVVVKADGTVGDVKVTQSLDAVYGLDEQAIKAMKRWEFKPPTTAPSRSTENGVPSCVSSRYAIDHRWNGVGRYPALMNRSGISQPIRPKLFRTTRV